MGLFRYEAVNKSGKVLHGAIDAADEQQVAQLLAQRGFTVRAIIPTGPAKTQTVAAQPAPRPAQVQPKIGMAAVTVASGVPVSVRPIVAPSRLAVFFRQLSTLVKSGMPISQALYEMDALVRNARLKRLLPQMREATQGGRSLSSLMAQYPNVFPVHTIASIYSGEMAGKLEVALDEVASDLEQEASETRYGKLGWGLTKINWIFFIFLLPACNVVALLIPVLGKILNKPNATGGEVLAEVWRNYVDTMLGRSLLIAAAMVAFWIGWGYVKRVPAAKRLFDGLLLSVPIWGSLHHGRAVARFTHVLDGLYSAGVNPAAAWDAASLTVRNSAIAEKLRLARDRVSPAASVSELFAASGVFDGEDVAFAATGEKAGRVAETLAHMSKNYTERAAVLRTTGRTTAIFLMIICGLAIGFYGIYSFAASYVDLSFHAAEMMK